MTKKDSFRDNILLKMQHHLDPVTLSMLENTLIESLYSVDLIDINPTSPAVVDDTNSYILQLFELKRGMHLSKYTLKEYLITIKEFINITNRSLTQTTSEDVEYYLAIKKKQNCSNTTLNNKRRNLNTFFVWMMKNHFVSDNPVDTVPSFKEVLKPVDHMSALDFELLKTGCKTKRDRAMIEFFRCTAMRRGEIPDVRINQVDWKTGKILIYGEKGSAYRIVLIDDIAIKYLTDYITLDRNIALDSDEPLFTYMRGDKSKSLGRPGIYAAIKKIAKRSDLDKRIYPHLFRKTTGSNIIKRGGTVDDVSSYLGHKPQGVASRHYIHTSEDHSAEIFTHFIRAV